jgi:phage baseplate assembly protein W
MYDDDVKQSIRIILGTDQGERVMRPDFGAGLRSFVFGPVNSTILQRIKTRVQDALTTWEPRIDVLQVTVTFAASDRSALLIDITYRVRSTNTLQNLVYPFYLQEGSPQ